MSDHVHEVARTVSTWPADELAFVRALPALERLVLAELVLELDARPEAIDDGRRGAGRLETERRRKWAPPARAAAGPLQTALEVDA